MTLYSLESKHTNNGEHEDYWGYNLFHGVFSTIEKAKEFAEEKIELHEEVSELIHDKGTFKVLNDWEEGEFFENNKGMYKHIPKCIYKRITFGQYYPSVWDVIYFIEEVEVDPKCD